MVKKSEIKIVETDGWFQVVVRDHCQTEPKRSADSAYRSYIKVLIDSIEGARDYLRVQTY